MRRKKDHLLDRARRKMDESAGQAEDYARNPSKIWRLINSAKVKLMEMDDHRSTFKNIVRHVGVFIQMLRDYSRGYYPQLPWKSLTAIIGALLYFLNPFDIIPDFIPGIGLLDDLTLLTWVYRSVEGDVENYLAWEQGITARNND